MGSVITKIIDTGIVQSINIAMRRLKRYSFKPYWYIYKLTSRQHGFAVSINEKEHSEQILQSKEQFLQSLLLRNKAKRFLEIGIGASPNIERIQLIKDNNINYTACDFLAVCDHHKKEFHLKGIDTQNIRFTGNRVGSYSWTLFEMLSRNERFDIIYLDGHHTFYIDLPAMVLAHQLLEPGGYFLVDDIQWTLAFLKSTFFRSFDNWYFYRNMYNFAEYEAAQQELPHIKMIVEQILIKELGYLKLDNYSIPEWWALQKPGDRTKI